MGIIDKLHEGIGAAAPNRHQRRRAAALASGKGDRAKKQRVGEDRAQRGKLSFAAERKAEHKRLVAELEKRYK